MADETPSTGPSPRRSRHRRKPGRFGYATWAAGVVAAGLLALGVSGTLSSWTSAIIDNSGNTVATAHAVILKEDGPNSATCLSSDGAGAENSFTCTTIDKYGGTASALAPGDSRSVSVTLTNVGTESGSLELDAGACTTTGGLSVGKTDACGAIQVRVECPSGTATYPSSGAATLSDFDVAPPTTVSASLAANSSVTCNFTVTLPSDASPTYADQVATQSLTWTLTGS